MDIRDRTGRFTKGTPGGGRPRKRPTFEELVEVTAMEAITRLFEILHSDDESVVIQASAVILDFVSKADGYYENTCSTGDIASTLQYIKELGQR